MLVVAGTDEGARQNLLPQVWQTGSGSWRNLTGAQRDLPYYPYMHVTASGDVFNAGPNQDTKYLKTSGTGAWTTEGLGNGGLRNFGFRSYGSSAMYADDKVLVVGGADPPDPSAEVIDLTSASATWRYVGSMASPRRHHNATLLPDGKVLVTGGSSGHGFNNAAHAVYAAEMWDPATGTWTTLAKNTRFRGYHSTALLLPDGRVLSAGGDNEPNAEIYSPPYLFNGARPTISSAPESVSYGQTFSVKTPDAAGIAKVSWVRLASVTHALDMNQRINFPSYAKTADGLNVTAPSSMNLAPPGHYMLFILNGNGVPSVGKIIQVGDGGGSPTSTPTPTPTSPPTSTPTPTVALGPTSTPTATPTLGAGIPAAPSGLTATAVSASQINLAWRDNSANEDGFKIERSTDGATFTQVATAGRDATSYSDTALSAGTRYHYRVRAHNAAGNSAYSATARARTPRR